MKERLSQPKPTSHRKRLTPVIVKAAAPLFMASAFLASCAPSPESQVVGSVPEQTCPKPVHTNEQFEIQYADEATAEAANDLRAWLEERICQKATQAAQRIVKNYQEVDHSGLVHKDAGVRGGVYHVGYRLAEHEYADTSFGLNAEGGPDFGNLLAVSSSRRVTEDGKYVGMERYSATKTDGLWGLEYSKSYLDPSHRGTEHFSASESLTSLPLHATMADLGQFRADVELHTTLLAAV
jgi:hypothetical protein